MNDHAGTLKTMIHQRDDGEPCICAECRAVQAAIAAMEAGRSGEAGEWVLLPRKATPELLSAMGEATFLNDGSNLEMARRYNGLIEAAATQQPPPVGVTDAMVKAARRAYNDAEVLNGSDPLGWIRAAIEAALSQQEPAPSVSHDEFFGPVDRRAVIFPPKPAHPAPVSEPAASRAIPPGVYYSAEHDNFYRASDRKGMGTPFYCVWRHRWREFPRAGGMDPEQHTS